MTVPEPTDPTSTIDHIDYDDEVTVDQPQSTEPTCLDVGGEGQWSDTFGPCELPTTTTEVAVGTPPVPAELPATGGANGVTIAIAVGLVAAGVRMSRALR